MWGGLLLAALGLGRLAVEAAASFGGLAPPTTAGDREWSVGFATVGIFWAFTGTYLTADRARLRKGLRFGALATLGFLAIFTLIGLPIALFARELVPALGVAAVVVGLALVALGIYTLAGRHLTLPIRLFSPKAEGPGGFFVFGIAYGLAALSCTFPIFLVVVALALVSGGFVTAVLAFAAYALGKGAVLTLVTVLSTSSPAAVEGRIRKALPMFDKVMAAVLVAAGAFIAYYFGVLYAPV
jgi:cytochrome c-type biogenesis protein